MASQSEQILENNLVKQLASLNFDFVKIEDENALINNFKTQLGKLNNIEFTDAEFNRVLNHLNKGNIFERAETLRDSYRLEKDDGEGVYINFLDQLNWDKNIYQVTNQVTMVGSFKNRYDVTILINGLPLVQIELKRKGLEIKEAFNQTNRYRRHSYGAGQGLFNFIQLFVISNGVNTKYYSNNKHQSFQQTFYWTDETNNRIGKLEDFTNVFLQREHLFNMISKYIVLNQAQKILMVLRPYQYYATEAILKQVKTTNDNGYIFHTTGSGKTLTSFKTSQLLTQLAGITKVVFVVDRKDLDYQTTKEFNDFSEGSVDGTDNTKALVKQFTDDTKLIVTTIQKLDNAIVKGRYAEQMKPLRDKKMVFIFDECHRSQFGDTHNRIKKYFNNVQMFGFTGTPIFEKNASKNALGKRTTKDLFDKRLHSYVITDAINDGNVLRFSIEYVGKYKRKESANEVDIEVEDINTREILEHETRVEKIVDYIIANHDRKTHSREFTSILCVSSTDVLTKYYSLFKKKKEEGKHTLRVATIFSYSANEDDKDANGFIPDDMDSVSDNAEVNSHTRDKLESYIGDYNKMYGSNYTTKDSKSFYNYYNNIAKRVKNREVDVLLVVNMFLTGFDSKTLNTIYVDKNLKYHGLIQAYSRTNRILNEVKSQGNVICFRNLKENTDDAIALFSDKNAKEVITMPPYQSLVDKFNSQYTDLLKIAHDVEAVDGLYGEEEKMSFIKAFRDLIRTKNVLSTFVDFSFAHLEMDEQLFNDYRSKYVDLYEETKNINQKEKVSILNDIDFELELLHRDEINVDYIIKLLAKVNTLTVAKDIAKEQKRILDLLSGDVSLRSKRELIEKFIHENLPHIEESNDVDGEFKEFWDKERELAFESLCSEEGIVSEKLRELLDDFLFTGRQPLREQIVDALVEKPKLLERKTILERINDKLQDFINTFVEGMDVAA